MIRLIFILFSLSILGQDLTLDLKGETMFLPIDFEQTYDNIIIKNGTIESNFIKPIELDLDNYKNKDGVYVVAKGKFIGGGYYPAIDFNGIYVSFGSVIELKNGVWLRYNVKRGYQFKGNLIVENVKFQNIPFFIFHPIGLNQDRTINISNSEFINVRRVIGTDRTNRHWMECSLNCKTVQDGINFNFKLISFTNNTFNKIHESIMWNTLTAKKVVFNDNILSNSPNIASVINQLPVTNSNPKAIEFYIKNSSAEIRNNIIKDCVNHSYDRTAVYRHFFRVLSNSVIDNNRFDNINGIVALISGGGNIISNNYIRGFYAPNSEPQTGFFVHKHAVMYGNKNLIYNNDVEGNQPFFTMTFANDYDLVDNKFKHLSENSGLSYALHIARNKNYPQNITINDINNSFDSNIRVRYVGGIDPELKINTIADAEKLTE